MKTAPTPQAVWRYLAYCLILPLAIHGACTTPSPPPTQNYQTSRGVLVCNQGNFTYGNATLSYYNPDSGTVANRVFFNANGFPMGDVLQSVCVNNQMAWAVINNSGKVFGFSATNFKHTGTLTGLASPRYMLHLHAQKAYVSDLYQNVIHIINPTTMQKTGNIALGHSTEQMVALGGSVFVGSWSYNNKVFKIDAQTDAVIDSVQVPLQPNSLTLDANGHLWVLSDGGFAGSPHQHDTATLTCLNPTNLQVIRQFKFNNMALSPTGLTTNAAADSIFYLVDGTQPGLYAMPIAANQLPTSPFIAAGGSNFNGLAIDRANGHIYITDAKDYQQKGRLLRYSPTGTAVDSVQVGIIPGYVGFTN